MPDTASSFLTPWLSFYVMTGSSAAALTGLMFVVITLVTRAERTENMQDGISTFSTPTVMHFAGALLISAALAAPWHSLLALGIVLGISGLCGTVYLLRIAQRTKGLSVYTADREDWIWYNVLPLVAYVAIFASAIALLVAPAPALFALGATVIALIFIGIRNAWDVVTYLAMKGPSA